MLWKPVAMIRVHRIPFSTNVERVALAAGVKGIEVEWVDHDPGDRSEIVRPPLYPAAPHARALAGVFVEWFNEVWKGPPNELDEELAKPDPDPAAIEGLTARMSSRSIASSSAA